MSNKIVPAIYRAVIDDVISSIKSDFDEYGVSEEVLADLQQKWENKVIASHVAEFEVPAPPPPPASYPPHPIHSQQQHPVYSMHNPYAPPPPPPPPQATMVKSEPVDSRHILNYHQPMPHYTVPTLPGPPLRPPPTAQQPIQQQPYGSQAGRPGTSAPRPYSVTPNSYQQPPAATAQQATTARIPQVDGPSSSGSDSGSSPPQQYAPSRSHLPQPEQQPAAQADDEAINSDLDDSDSEGSEDPEEGGLGETDIVFCTYDKVARVKNKWKCVLKEGMIHVNGKDYLFGKCSGEFEW